VPWVPRLSSSSWIQPTVNRLQFTDDPSTHTGSQTAARQIRARLSCNTKHSVLFFSRPRSDSWPPTPWTYLSVYPCSLSFWLTLPRRVLSTSWCCPSRPCVVFLACVHLALFLTLCIEWTLKYDEPKVEHFPTEGHHILMSHERPWFICFVVWPTTSLKLCIVFWDGGETRVSIVCHLKMHTDLITVRGYLYVVIRVLWQFYCRITLINCFKLC